jgi:pimeloyl-ACP methyl ester carboxylesterase/catechol 2,3-dioxygenase-like lactoylglutathione lyase family enzyme
LIALAALLAVLAAAPAASRASPAGTSPPPALQVLGIELEVTDVGQAVELYADGLGFELLDRGPDTAILRSGTVLLGLRHAPEGPAAPPLAVPRVHAEFETANLKRTLERLGQHQVKVLEGRPLPTAGGIFVTIRDPSGHLHRLVELAALTASRINRPVLREVAIEVPDLGRAREFYGGLLGLAPATLTEPPLLPLGDARAPRVLLRPSVREAGSLQLPSALPETLLLGTANLGAATAALAARGIELLGGVQQSPLGRYASFKDPLGNTVELVEPRRSWAAAPALPLGPEARAGLAWEPYTVHAVDGRAIEAALGHLTVPENRQQAGGRTVRLAFLRFASTAARPGPPIVYLAGGPGGSGIADAAGNRLPLFLALRQVADVIALDQRGTGLSRPELTCSESWSIPLTRPAEPEEILSLAGQHSWACARALRRSGIDLAGYNTRESADDLEDLRRALGVPRLSLLGYSYGTHLALAAMRRHPAGVAAAALAGFEGPDQLLRLPSTADEELATISRLAAAGSATGGAAPDLAAALRKLYAHLEERPETILIQMPWSNSEAQVTVGRFDLQWMVAQSLASRAGIAKLPGQVAAMERRDYSALGAFALASRRGWLGSAVPYAIQCASGISAERLQRIERERETSLLGRALDFPFPDICEAWSVPDLGPEFRAPVRTEVPTLFISGTLDVRTPASDAAEARAAFAHGSRLLVEGGSHGDDLLVASPEIGRTIVKFFAGEPVADSSIRLEPLAFQPAR